MVKPVFWAFRHELFTSLDVGVLIVWCGAGVLGLWTNSLLLTVLSLRREVVEVRSVLMLLWALEVLH